MGTPNCPPRPNASRRMVEASWTRIVNGESNDGVLVVKYVDVGRRGQLGGGDKRADSCDRHEARQGSPPFNPAQDQLGRDDMVAGEDGLADFCEFGMRSTRRRRDRPPCRDSAPGSRRAHRWHQSRRGGGSAKKNRTPARQAAMPACLSWVLSLSQGSAPPAVRAVARAGRSSVLRLRRNGARSAPHPSHRSETAVGLMAPANVEGPLVSTCLPAALVSPQEAPCLA